MVDIEDNGFEPARDIYIQKIIYVFNDGVSWLDTNKSYWPQYKYDLAKKIEKNLKEGFTVGDKSYTAEDLISITIIYPE